MNEHAAPTAEGILAKTLEQMAEAIVGLADDDRIVVFNAAAERLWGCSRSDVLGESGQKWLPQLAAVLPQGGEPLPRPAGSGSAVEISIGRPDGTMAVGALAGSQLMVEGRLLKLAQVRDITSDVRSREELRLMALGSSETVRAVMITDAQRRIAYINDAFIGTFGCERAEVIGLDWADAFAGQATGRDSLSQLARRADLGEAFHQVLLLQDRHGRDLWVKAAVNPVVDASGRIGNVVSVIDDITESKQIELLQRDVLEALAQDLPLRDIMHRVCLHVEKIAPDVICSVLAVDEGDRLRTLAAPSLSCDLAAAVDGMKIGPRVGSCGTAAYRREPVVAVDIATDPLWEGYGDIVLQLGLLACWSSPIMLKDGKVAGTFAFYFRERRAPSPWHETIVATCLHLCVLALERAESKARITRLANFDTLTGLPNRARLRESIGEMIATEGRGRNLALLLVDIDRFKDVNNTLGPSVGDRLLVETVRRLQHLLGPHDVLSRYAGDVFVVALDDADAGRASGLAAKLIETLLAPVVIENILLPVSASVGVSLYPDDGRDEDTLLRHADTAMHEAKTAGGGTFRFFSPAMNSAAQERLVLGAALREAIIHRQLTLAYQPQVECRTGSVCGAEALARWTHPILGEVSPARFIALAEECGLIEAIGQWALDEACNQLASWHRQGMLLPSMSVNLSAIHFRNPALTGFVAQALARHRLQPDMLTIEITEGVIMDDNPMAIETAKAIHALGVRLSLDDFGTGYSSLGYLSRLPIDELKIDRSFMRDLANDRSAQAVVTAVVRIGQSLSLSVVAEGVETRAQQNFLEGLGCDVLQGYLFSRGLGPAAFEDWYSDYAAAAQLRNLSGAA